MDNNDIIYFSIIGFFTAIFLIASLVLLVIEKLENKDSVISERKKWYLENGYTQEELELNIEKDKEVINWLEDSKY